MIPVSSIVTNILKSGEQWTSLAKIPFMRNCWMEDPSLFHHWKKKRLQDNTIDPRWDFSAVLFCFVFFPTAKLTHQRVIFRAWQIRGECWNDNWMAPGKNHVTAISTEILKYVRIHPNFASQPVWCEKMFLCCFSLKAGRKDLTSRPKVLSTHPLPPPHCFLPCSTGFSYLVHPNSAIFRRKGAIGGGGGGERTSGLFVKSFLPAFRKKQHRNIFSNHTGQLAKFGWILINLKFSVEMAVTWFLPGAIQLLSIIVILLGSGSTSLEPHELEPQDPQGSTK